MNRLLLKILCCFIIFLQFNGCATTFPPQHKYQQQKNEAPQILMSVADVVTPKIFDIKLDEIRQKSNQYLPTGAIRDSILDHVSHLQLVTDEHYRRIKKVSQKGAVIGAVTAGVCCAAYFASNADNINDNPFTAILVWPSAVLLTVLALLPGSLAGSFAGSLIVAGKVNEPVTQQNTEKLRVLINTYNSLVTAPTIGDTCQ